MYFTMLNQLLFAFNLTYFNCYCSIISVCFAFILCLCSGSVSVFQCYSLGPGTLLPFGRPLLQYHSFIGYRMDPEMCVSISVMKRNRSLTERDVCVSVCVCGAYDCRCNLLSPASHSYYSCRYGAQGFIDTSNKTQSGRPPECVCACQSALYLFAPLCVHMCVHDPFAVCVCV